MHVQELQDPKKVSAIWVENMNSLVNKMDKTKSSMIDIKPKDAIKQDIYIYISQVNSMEIKKYGIQTLPGLKTHIN